jgi:adenine-specific DNA-methyltransferase
VVTFVPEASPFPGVDTNPIIFMIRNGKPQDYFTWARCIKSETDELKKWTLSGFAKTPGNDVLVFRRRLAEALTTGLSRSPARRLNIGPALADFASVLRGIATGANDFFFLTTKQAAALRIPEEFLIPAVGRTRDVPSDELTHQTLRNLEAKGRPTLLFSPDGRPIHEFPRPVREYLKKAEQMEIHKRPLISTRRPWYKMETRSVPPILFAYLGRRNARFIRNLAGVVPLTSFLCIYPHREEPAFVGKLWEVLQYPTTISNLQLVGKSYGAGAIKVEPRSLEKLPLPTSILSKVDLQPQILMPCF